MDIKIHLCREPPIYTAADEVSGHVILTTATQVDISAVTVRLSGVASSRLRSLRVIETHQIVDIRERLFPPTACASSFTSRCATAAAGKHIFAFSIRLPQETQCSKTTGTFPVNEKQTSMSANRKTHLLRKLPPSTGAGSSPEEIKYVLEASVRRDGIILGAKKATETRRITRNTSAGSKILSAPLTYEVTAKLLNGPFLFLGQPIPLAVELTSLDTDTDTVPRSRASTPIPISLHDFQTMLIETTEIRARGMAETITQFRIVQTMANMRHPLIHTSDNGSNSVTGNRASVLRLRLDGIIWSRYFIPPSLTPSFETCNISHSYKLDIRLGIGFGRNNVRIVEFQLPVYLVSVPGTRLGMESGLEAPAGIKAPAPDYYEKHAFAKELELGL
ncbi:hypothetical protein BDW71DRAFT_203676 [Aspergillus fruticulosus]